MLINLLITQAWLLHCISILRPAMFVGFLFMEKVNPQQGFLRVQNPTKP
ncbi:hypothetical protein [uncultured Rubinisphaera sp.]